MKIIEEDIRIIIKIIVKTKIKIIEVKETRGIMKIEERDLIQMTEIKKNKNK
jgi:hypothetical protein